MRMTAVTSAARYRIGTSQLSYSIADANYTARNNPRVYPTQPKFTANRGIHEGGRVRAESCFELTASGVRRRRDFDDRLSDGEPRPNR